MGQIMKLIAVLFTYTSSILAESVVEIEDGFALPYGFVESSYENHDSIVICQIWLDARFRTGLARFNLEGSKSELSFDGNLCTHVVYQGLTLNELTAEIKVDDNYEFLYRIKDNIAKEFPHLKTIAEIWISGDSLNYDRNARKLKNLISTKENQMKIINSLKDAASELQISGFHFASEFGLNLCYKDDDFIKFAKVIRDEFKKNGLLLTTEIHGFSTDIIEMFYGQVVQISRIFDYIVVQGFDFDLGTQNTSHNSPLYSWEDDEIPTIENTLVYLINEKWVRPENLILKVPCFGGPYALDSKDLSLHGLSSNKVTKIGESGPILSLSTIWAYFEICYAVQSLKEPWKVYWDEDSEVPFMKNGINWVTFDNPKSIYEKTAYANGLGLSGIMTEYTDMDDFSGICSGVTYPLLKSINYAMKKTEMDKSYQLCSTLKYYKTLTNKVQHFEEQKTLVTVKPYNLYKSKGEDVEITCTVEALPIQSSGWYTVDASNMRSIEWYKVSITGTETRLTTADKNVVFQYSTSNHACLPYTTTVSTLIIRKMELDHFGKYICRVTEEKIVSEDESNIICDSHCSEIEEAEADFVPVHEHEVIPVTPTFYENTEGGERSTEKHIENEDTTTTITTESPKIKENEDSVTAKIPNKENQEITTAAESSSGNLGMWMAFAIILLTIVVAGLAIVFVKLRNSGLPIKEFVMFNNGLNSDTQYVRWKN